MDNLFIFDCEVFAFDWLFVFKHKATGEYTVIHNDNEAVKQFMEQEPLLAGFNNKHYDQFILKAVLADYTPEEVKVVNDFIIVQGHEGWEYPDLRESRIYFDQYDLMDDCQMGLSLKAIEAHLGMDIRETTVSFNLDRPLTPEELEEVIFYCKHDVDATDKLDDLRQGYLSSKLTLGKEKGIYPAKALYMTNAKLTAAYLNAEPKPHYDEREYQYPATLLRQYIPQEVFAFFDRLKDMTIPNEVVFKEKLEIMVGDCPCTMAYGVPVEQTIMECNKLLDFQLIAKAGSKYGDALHEVDGELQVVQKVNRVYATDNHRMGTLYKMHLSTGNPVKIAGLPSRCVVDNDNHLSIEVIDRDWYIRLAKRYVRDFLGIKPPKRNTRRVNKVKRELTALLEG